MGTQLLNDTLKFSSLTPADITRLKPLLDASASRACDMTVGGIFLWVDYFCYHAAVVDDTLFIKGVTEDDVTRPAFSVPVGRLPLSRSVEMLRRYCDAQGERLRFSAVPEEALPELASIPGAAVDELTDFADYLYDIQSLATLAGKHLNKKRNHIHHFTAAHPDYIFEPITPANIAEVRDFYSRLPRLKDSPSAVYEAIATERLLGSLSLYPFEAWLLRVPGRGIVAFSIAEVKGDTLHEHVEKMDHEVDGAGEMVNMLMARTMADRYPALRYVNRQDDAGDPGLRQAKQSYHPAMLVRKYNVTL